MNEGFCYLITTTNEIDSSDFSCFPEKVVCTNRNGKETILEGVSFIGYPEVAICANFERQGGSYTFIKTNKNYLGPTNTEIRKISCADDSDALVAANFFHEVFKQREGYRSWNDQVQYCVKEAVGEYLKKYTSLFDQIDMGEVNGKLNYLRDASNLFNDFKSTLSEELSNHSNDISKTLQKNREVFYLLNNTIPNISFQLLKFKREDCFFNEKGKFDAEKTVQNYYENEKGFGVQKLVMNWKEKDIAYKKNNKTIRWCDFFKRRKGIPDFIVFSEHERFFLEVKTGQDGLRLEQMKTFFDNPNYHFVVCWAEMIEDKV